MGWTLHMIMCVLLCYPVSIHMLQLLSTGRPISSLFGIFVKSHAKFIPNKLNSEALQYSLCKTFNMVFEDISLPIHTKRVFSVLILRPDSAPKICNIFKATCNELTLPSNMIVVSSANCASLYIILPTVIPVTSEELWIRQAKSLIQM